MIKPPYYVFVKNNKKIIANKVSKVYKNAHAPRLDSYMNMSSETNLVGCRVLSVFESDWLHWLQDRRFDDGTESGIVWHSRQFFAFNHQRDAIYRLDGGQYVYCGNFGQLSAA
ncbi:putative uncharacterized protein [Ligilactobacillus ruminis CAG:367]|nr:putative uncharacterized protein [Ligilactobacillus ruminis CAG:367]